MQQIKETQAEHEKGFFSWFTRSHLVQAYKRAIVLIDDSIPPLLPRLRPPPPRLRPPPPRLRPSPSPSWWQKLLAWFRRPPHVPGDRPPPSPPGAAGAAAALRHINVEPYMPHIQAKLSQGNPSSGWRYQFRQLLRNYLASIRAQVAAPRHMHSQIVTTERAQQVETNQAQTLGTYPYMSEALAGQPALFELPDYGMRVQETSFSSPFRFRESETDLTSREVQQQTEDLERRMAYLA